MKLQLKELGGLEIDRARVNPNFDRQAVSRLIRNHRSAVKAQTDLAFENSQREVDAMRVVAEANLLSVDPKKAKLLSARLRKDVEAMAVEKPPVAEISRGHNPNLFPPFWDGGYFATEPKHQNKFWDRREETGLSVAVSQETLRYSETSAARRRDYCGRKESSQIEVPHAKVAAHLASHFPNCLCVF
jgi:hypothetical protein